MALKRKEPETKGNGRKNDHYVMPAHRQKIDIETALKLRLKGLSLNEIGKYFGVSAQAVHDRLKNFHKLLDVDISEIIGYEANKEIFLSAVERELLTKMLDPDKLKGASLNNMAYAFQQIFNANRLARGQSTSNVSYQEISSSLEEVEAELAALQGGVIEADFVTVNGGSE